MKFHSCWLITAVIGGIKMKTALNFVKYCLKALRLKHSKTKCELLHVTSESYTKIVRQLSRLECSNYIHIFMDKLQTGDVIVDLARMQLKFEVDPAKDLEYGQLMSNEFAGMRVSLQQNCGNMDYIMV